MTCRPLSVLEGTDAEALKLLLRLHCDVEQPRILDCTYNVGKMWKGLPFKPHRMDIDPSLDVDTVADFTAMPFDDGSFDVLVFDPPHLPVAAASEGSSKIWEQQYGITDSCEHRQGDNVSPLFPLFLREAKRVLREDGIILAKIADLTHNHRYQWQHVDFINAVFATGMTPCDALIKRDPKAGNLKSSKWQNVKHLRKAHCYWIVVRNSRRCECRKKEA
jgi:hypothetical protein